MSDQKNPYGLEAGMIAECMDDPGWLGVVKEIPGGFLAVEARGRVFTDLTLWQPHRIHRENIIIPLTELPDAGQETWEYWELVREQSLAKDRAFRLVAKARRRALDLGKPTFEEPAEPETLIRVTCKDGKAVTLARNDRTRWVSVSGDQWTNLYTWDEIIDTATNVEVLYDPAKDA